MSPAFSQGTSPKRSVPRYKLTVPLALTVLRSGIPNHIPGHDLEIGEGGMGVVRKCKSKYRQIESAASVTSPRPAFLQVDSLSFHLVQILPVTSLSDGLVQDLMTSYTIEIIVM